MAHPSPTTTDAPMSIFDAHHPPDPGLIEDCVHCGFCLPTCPTYLLWGEEMDSPRGRIYLMDMAVKGEAKLDCDLCAAYGSMSGLYGLCHRLSIGRAVRETDRGNARTNRASIHAFTAGSCSFDAPCSRYSRIRDRLRLAAAPLWLYQRSGMRTLVQRSGLLERLTCPHQGDGSACCHP